MRFSSFGGVILHRSEDERLIRLLGVLAIGVKINDEGLHPTRHFPIIGLSDRPSEPLSSVLIGNPASLLDRLGGVKITSESRLRI